VEMGAMLTTSCKNTIVTKSKDMKIGCNLAESSKESYGSKRAVLLMMMIMMIIMKRNMSILEF
jgi:hypothetical protein